jgi:hypothetical protein
VSEELPRNLKLLGVIIHEAEIPRFSCSTAEGAPWHLLDARRRRTFHGLKALAACSAILLL